MKNLCDNLKVPVSCKIRLLQTYDDTIKFIKLMQKSGIRWITVHLRTVD